MLFQIIVALYQSKVILNPETCREQVSVSSVLTRSKLAKVGTFSVPLGCTARRLILNIKHGRRLKQQDWDWSSSSAVKG